MDRGREEDKLDQLRSVGSEERVREDDRREGHHHRRAHERRDEAVDGREEDGLLLSRRSAIRRGYAVISATHRL